MQLSSKAIKELGILLHNRNVVLSGPELQEFGVFLLTITAESIKLK